MGVLSTIFTSLALGIILSVSEDAEPDEESETEPTTTTTSQEEIPLQPLKVIISGGGTGGTYIPGYCHCQSFKSQSTGNRNPV